MTRERDIERAMIREERRARRHHGESWWRRIFRHWFGCHEHWRRPARLSFTFESGETVTGTHLEIKMFINQSVVATLAPVNVEGGVAAINGDAVFTTDHPELIGVTAVGALDSRLSGIAGAVVPAGGVAVTVTAKFQAVGADPSVFITATAVLRIDEPLPLPAVGGTISFSAPTP